MEKEKLGYQSPALEVIMFHSVDVITASGDDKDPTFVTTGKTETWLDFTQTWGGGN